MSDKIGPGFRRWLFFGRLAAELARMLSAEEFEPAPFPSNDCSLGPDEVAVVLADASLSAALAGPPPFGLGEGADRIGGLSCGERPDSLDAFWSARLYFSLPKGSALDHIARGIGSLLRLLEERARAARDWRALLSRTEEIQALVEVGIALSAETDPTVSWK